MPSAHYAYVNFSAKRWRVPDFAHVHDERMIWAVWYGPAGAEEDCATVVEEIEQHRWLVTEYQDTTGYFDVPQPAGEEFLKTSCEVVSLDARCAAGKGVDMLANMGGDECFVGCLLG